MARLLTWTSLLQDGLLKTEELEEEKMRILVVNGNKIEIDLLSLLTGKETIYYNGELVSQKKSILGSLHTFTVQENGVAAKYDVKVGLAMFLLPTVEIKRNDELLYSDNSGSNPRGVQI